MTGDKEQIYFKSDLYANWYINSFIFIYNFLNLYINGAFEPSAEQEHAQQQHDGQVNLCGWVCTRANKHPPPWDTGLQRDTWVSAHCHLFSFIFFTSYFVCGCVDEGSQASSSFETRVCREILRFQHTAICSDLGTCASWLSLHTHTHTHIERERERERDLGLGRALPSDISSDVGTCASWVSFGRFCNTFLHIFAETLGLLKTRPGLVVESLLHRLRQVWSSSKTAVKH